MPFLPSRAQGGFCREKIRGLARFRGLWGRPQTFAIVLCLRMEDRREPACADARSSKLGLEGPILELCSKCVLQTEAPTSGRINEQEGCFSLFPGKQNARICRCVTNLLKHLPPDGPKQKSSA